jgi:actin cytoskeleton-regulatory complex protein PAN1
MRLLSRLLDLLNKYRPSDDMTFQIALAYPRGGDAVSLRATSIRDCQLWMQMIDDASRRCREAEKRAVRRTT